MQRINQDDVVPFLQLIRSLPGWFRIIRGRHLRKNYKYPALPKAGVDGFFEFPVQPRTAGISDFNK
jgi:hypothetical protein